MLNFIYDDIEDPSSIKIKEIEIRPGTNRCTICSKKSRIGRHKCFSKAENIEHPNFKCQCCERCCCKDDKYNDEYS